MSSDADLRRVVSVRSVEQWLADSCTTEIFYCVARPDPELPCAVLSTGLPDDRLHVGLHRSQLVDASLAVLTPCSARPRRDRRPSRFAYCNNACAFLHVTGLADLTLRHKMVMVLTHRSRVYETRDTSPADVASSWYGLSPTLRLTLDLAPVGTPGCCL